MVRVRDLQRERLRRYLEAEAAILQGQSYTLDGRMLTRANLASVRAAIDGLLAAGVTLEDEPRPHRIARAVFTN